MDAYYAKIIQQSYISLHSMINNAIDDTGNPPQLPQEYYRYLNAELHDMPQTDIIMPQIGQQLLQHVQYTIKFPLSALGLLQIKAKDACLWEIGALVTPKLVVTPYCFQNATQAKFYPAFNFNKYSLSINIKNIDLHPEKQFSVAQLDYEGDISKVTGKFGLRMNEGGIFQSSDQNQRGGRQRRPRGRRERRQGQDRNEIAYRKGNIIKVVTYASIQGVISLINLDLTMDKFHNWIGSNKFQGICLYIHDGGFMSFIGIIKKHKFTFISHDDIVQSNDQVSRKLVCFNLGLGEQEILWLANKKWSNLVTLDLQNNRIDKYACQNLASLDCTQLKELNLNKNPIRSEGCFELKKIRFPQLRKLELKNALIGNDGCRWLSLTHLPSLTELNLRNDYILQSGCALLAKAEWPKLKRLNLSRNKIGNKGCQYLSKAKWDLEVALLKDCQIQDSGCKWLNRAKWRSLRELDLEENYISQSGYKWLGKSNWKYLAKLMLASNIQISNESITQFATLASTSIVSLSFDQEITQFKTNLLLKADFPHFSKLKIKCQHQRRGQRQALKKQWIEIKFPNCRSHVDFY